MPSAFSSRSRASIARPTIRQSSSCSKLFSSSVSSDFVNCPPWRHEELTPSLVGSVRLWFERRAGLLQKASPALLAEPIAVTADCDHGAVVDRKRVVEGKSVYVRVDLGGRRLIKKHKTTMKQNTTSN